MLTSIAVKDEHSLQPRVLGFELQRISTNLLSERVAHSVQRFSVRPNRSQVLLLAAWIQATVAIRLAMKHATIDRLENAVVELQAIALLDRTPGIFLGQGYTTDLVAPCPKQPLHLDSNIG